MKNVRNAITGLNPSHIHVASDPRNFVFGSNELGIHGAGAALYAHKELAVPQGMGEGITMRAYALPTCSRPGIPLPLDTVRFYVERFLRVARGFQEIRFFVSEVGCGHAGYSASDIAPLFAGVTANCDMPPGWRRLAGESVR